MVRPDPKRLVKYGLLILAVIACLIVFQLVDWGKFYCEMKGDGTGSEVVRNLGLVIGGVIAGIFAFWRIRIADRQADIAEREHLDDNFYGAAELLGHELIEVRTAAVEVLRKQAFKNLEDYGVQVTRVLNDFYRVKQSEHDMNPGPAELNVETQRKTVTGFTELYRGPFDGERAFQAKLDIEFALIEQGIANISVPEWQLEPDPL